MRVYIVLYRFPDEHIKCYSGVFSSQETAQYWIDVCIAEGIGMQRDCFYVLEDTIKTECKVY